MLIDVYVAGPYSQGNTEENVKKAIAFGKELVELGPFNPFIPHLFYYLDPEQKCGWDFWMRVCFKELVKRDVLLRTPGFSPGSTYEDIKMRSIGKPVFYSIKELLEWTYYNCPEAMV